MRRICALTLAIALVLAGTPRAYVRAAPGAGGGRPDVPSDRTPVLLILEPAAQSGGDTGGRPDDPGAVSLIACLEQAGFIYGYSLFALSPAAFQDVPEAATALAAFISDRVAWSPKGQVDVIACGISGLIARLTLEAGLVPFAAVRNLVMVSAPNRGTFVADLLKSITEIVKHEALLEQETRSASNVQYWEDSGGTPAGDGAKTAKWEGETNWIAARVREVYEPLYAKYVKERFYTLPFVPSEAPDETFAGWVRRTQPALWKKAVEGGTSPASGAQESPGTLPSPMRTPPAGADLSVAYYEILAMEVAKNQYVMRNAAKRDLSGVLATNYFSMDWKEMLIQYGLKVLAYCLQKAILTLKAEAQDYLARKLVSATGYASDPTSPMLRRLLKDDLIVSLGTSASQRFARLPANLYLSGLNAASSRLSARTTRYVSVSARLANPWCVVWPQLGPNDLLLEVDSAVAPQSATDLVAVFPGLFTPSGPGLLGDAKAQDYILGVLMTAEPGRPEVASAMPLIQGDKARKVTASSWQPAYVICEAAEDSAPAAGAPVGTLAAGAPAAGDGLYATITLPDPPEGWQFLIWIVGQGGQPVDAADVRVEKQGGACRIEIQEGDRVGLKMAWTGPANPFLAGTVGSAYAQEVRVPVTVAVAEGEAGTAESPQPGNGASRYDAWREAPVAEHPAPEDIPAQPGDLSPSQALPDDEPAGEPPPSSQAAVPLIRAVYRTKRTTLENPAETYHEYWKVDFGDGTTLDVQGSPELSLTHTYAAQGTYEASVTSIGNHGEELVSKEWTVEATAPGTTQEFACKSLARVGADLSLSGPKMWVTGKPADFVANLRLSLPSGVEVVSLEYDPGPRFQVLWERAGDFTVSCAAVVKLRYLLLDETVTVEDIFIRELTVNVLTTGVIQ